LSDIGITFYGTRGSIPICDPRFHEFGGNTTCIALTRKSNGRISIFDAGTGIRDCGKYINQYYPAQNDIFIAFSHFHWDHIQGLPFFDPAYNPEREINILVVGKDREFTNLQEIFTTQMQEVYFPVALDSMGAKFVFQLEQNNRYKDDDKEVVVYTIKQNHPGGSYGYRMEADGRVIVICTDLEHGKTVNEDIVDFARDADLLIHEAQYTNEELETHRGWGHSSYDQAIEVAERAGVNRLIMTHHDPDHDDEFLNTIEKKCKDRFKNCELAREGVEYGV
jgi:phosphoribosyl 1,2-cyclic phosphodiesterase